MSPAAQSWLQVIVIVVGIAASLVGAIFHQSHYIDKRIDDLRSELFRYLDAKFEAIEARLRRLEHPVSRP
ncbi:MAG TPA: hypothetical protein VMI06_16230 [Terriglobia bacterium]|nr:hypothetical protein [Terriglobia bacterium]